MSRALETISSGERADLTADSRHLLAGVEPESVLRKHGDGSSGRHVGDDTSPPATSRDSNGVRASRG